LLRAFKVVSEVFSPGVGQDGAKKRKSSGAG
jgi:hypothetical protein